MTKTLAKKYLSAIKDYKKRVVTCDSLSSRMGIYPEIIAENLSYFEPMLAMDLSFNLKDLIPMLEEYIKTDVSPVSKKPRVVVKKGEVEKFDSVADFMYKKLTLGGLVDRNAKLSLQDLKCLKKIIDLEIKKNKN